MNRAALETLNLTRPRTFDLRHVKSQLFAAALGNDPVRIFGFVRDAIGYEAYTGVLRGPEGTLLALAGNSADRAMLLASLLQQAGQQVRFARGPLPDREATALVASVWATRPAGAAPQGLGEVPQRLKDLTDAFAVSTERDYGLLRDRLREAKQPASPAAPPTVEDLVAEARSHYWVQWAKDGRWIDLDPSFSDASPGRTYAAAEETFAALPDALSHRVAIRVRVEELTEGGVVTRTLLAYEVKAADLAGTDTVLFHMPENWRGPAGLPGAITGAIENTGRVKPVLVIGERILPGDAFLQRPKTAGIGGLPSLLSGEGTRKPATVALAEWLEFDFLAPGGRRESVSRDLFDIVGKVRRFANRPLTAEEVVARTQGDKAVDITRAVYSLVFATGRIESAHFSRLEDDSAPGDTQPDVRRALRRIGMAFFATSDGVLSRLDHQDGTAILFYPESPRLLITELSALSGVERIGIDLRQTRSRVVAKGPRPDHALLARVLQGVMNGTLERMLIEHVTVELREQHGWAPPISTSSIFDQARADRVPFLFLPNDKDRLAAPEAHEGLVRVREEVDKGYLALAPQQPVAVSGALRFAWWRVDPRSGETTAVTDDGLHQGVELHIEHNQATGETTITWREFVGSAVNLATTQTVSVTTGSLAMGRFLGALLTAARVIREVVNR